MNANQKKNVHLIKAKGKKNDKNYYTCSDKCLQALVTDWRMFEGIGEILLQYNVKVINANNINNII